jgi:hypothetical protein
LSEFLHSLFLRCFSPLPAKEVETWGSRPIEGRDWGISERCDPVLLEIMEEQQCAVCEEAGKSDGCDIVLFCVIPFLTLF